MEWKFFQLPENKIAMFIEANWPILKFAFVHWSRWPRIFLIWLKKEDDDNSNDRTI